MCAIQSIPLNLASDVDWRNTAACLQAAGAAETAIELCMLMRRADVLWEEVFPRYLGCGQHPALLERLLPHILACKLPSFPPEVMQVSCIACMPHGSVTTQTSDRRSYLLLNKCFP